MATERTVLVRLKANVSDFNRGLAEAAVAVKGLRNEINTTNERTAWLVQGFLALAPALVPLGAAAVPVLSGITTQLTVGAAAAGVLALGLTGVGDGLKALDSYQLEPTAANFTKLQQAMEKLGPDGADFVRFLDSIEPKLRELQMTAKAGMLPGFEEGITDLLTLLPQFEAIISEISQGLGQLGAEAGAGLSGERFEEFFAFLQTDAKPILIEMGHTLGNFADGLAAMIVAFAPVSREFSSGFESMSKSFADWAHNLQGSDDFAAFLDYVDQAGPKALDFLGSLVGMFTQIVEAAAPIGDVLLPALSGLFDVIGFLADTPLGSVFIGLAAAMAIYGRAIALSSISTSGLGKVMVAGSRAAGIQVASVRVLTADLRVLSAAYMTAQQRAQMTAAQTIAAAEAQAVASARLRQSMMGIGKASLLVGGFALATSDAAQGLGLTNTASLALVGSLAGPWGAAIGAGVGLVEDFAARNKEAAVDVDGLTGTLNQQTGAITKNTAAFVAKDLEARGVLAAAAEYGIALDDVTRAALGNDAAMTRVSAGFARAGEEIKASATGPGDYANKLSDLQDAQDKVTGAVDTTSNALDEGSAAQKRIAAAARQTAADTNAASAATQDYLGSLTQLDNFLEGRSSFRAYQAALDDFTKGLKDNGRNFTEFTAKGRENLNNLDQISSTAIAFAKTLERNPARRDNFIAGYIDNLQDLKRETPAAADQVDKIIARLKALGEENPKPKADLDDGKLRQKIQQGHHFLTDLDNDKATPTADVNIGPAISAINTLKAYLHGIKDEQVNVHVTRTTNANLAELTARDNAYGGMYADAARYYAGGGIDAANQHQPEFAKPSGTPRVWLEPETQGESYIPHANDARRPRAKSILEQTAGLMGGQVQWFAEGGVLGGINVYGRSGSALGASAAGAARGLDSFRDHVERSRDSIEKETKQRDDLISRRNDIKSQVTGGLRSDIFATPDDPWASSGMSTLGVLRGDIREARAFRDAIEKLKAKGVSGGYLQDIVERGDLGIAQAQAAESRAQLHAEQRAYSTRQRVTSEVGAYAGNAVVGDKIDDTNRELRALKTEVKHLRNDVQKSAKETGEEVTKGLDKTAQIAHRDRPRHG